MSNGSAPAVDLVLAGLRKTYRQRGNEDVPAVRGIDLTVREGEFLGLLGPSGCGKSTTLRMIAGLEEISGGDIRIGGQSIAALPPHRRGVAVAFENYALYPPLTVEENITFGLKARKESDPTRRAREVAERLGITDILGRKPGALSSGQKQRVSLARAIVRRPRVLLLDEPLSHLDASEREQTRRELKRLQLETGYTTVLVTHDQHEALSLADRIAVMDGGLFKQVGTPDEVYDGPTNRFVADFVGEPRMNLLPGRLLPGADGTTAVALSEAVRVALSGAGGLAEGAVSLGIRPQDVRLVALGEAGAVAATVFAFEPLQEIGRLTVLLPGVEQRLVIETHHDFRAAGGDAVGLRFDSARTHLFDGTTGARLAWDHRPSATPSRPRPSSRATVSS